MTNNLKMQGRLKRAKLCYVAAGLVFTIILSFIVLCNKYIDSLSVTVAMLQKTRGDLMKMRDTGAPVDSSLSDIKAALPPRVFSETPQDLLFSALDDLKTRIRDSEITVENIEQKGDGLGLPVQIKSGMKNYTDFVNTVGYLQSLQFPFFLITNVSVAQAQDKVICEIKGTLRTPDNKGVGGVSRTREQAQ